MLQTFKCQGGFRTFFFIGSFFFAILCMCYIVRDIHHFRDQNVISPPEPLVDETLFDIRKYWQQREAYDIGKERDNHQHF
jgi:hypothetical protein